MSVLSTLPGWGQGMQRVHLYKTRVCVSRYWPNFTLRVMPTYHRQWADFALRWSSKYSPFGCRVGPLSFRSARAHLVLMRGMVLFVEFASPGRGVGGGVGLGVGVGVGGTQDGGARCIGAFRFNKPPRPAPACSAIAPGNFLADSRGIAGHPASSV